MPKIGRTYRITDEQCERIKTLYYKDKLGISVIAQRLGGRSTSSIHYIIKRENEKEVRQVASDKQVRSREVVEPIAKAICSVLEENGVKTQICGSLRRGCPTVGDVDVVVNKPQTRIYEILKQYPRIRAEETKKGGKYHWVIDGIQFDFVYSPEESWGAACLYLTGSGLFNILIRGIAKKQGYKLNEKGLFFGEDMIAGKMERQIFDVLGYEFLQPSEREVTVANKKRRWLKQKKEV